MKPLFFPLVAIVASCLSSRLCAEVVFFDEFNKPGSSASNGWYVRGENLESEKNVKEGSLQLGRKDGLLPVSRAGGIWKSFGQVSLKEGQTLRLTVVFSGAEVENAPFFRVALADSPNPIDANGGTLQEPMPSFLYELGLPSGAWAPRQEAGENLGFLEGASEEGIPSNALIAPCLLGFQSPPTAKPVFPGPQVVLAPGRYDNKAVLVWELHNEGGTMVSKGSWTGPEKDRTDMVEVRAGIVQHFDFNKVGIGFAVWDADWDGGKHLAESVSIDSIKLEKE